MIQMVHVVPRDRRQSVLFRHLLDDRYAKDHEAIYDWREYLPVLDANDRLEMIEEARRRDKLESGELAELIARAHWSWERISSWIGGPMTAKVWESIIPNMGYMALLRNLRNFDQAGVSESVKAQIIVKLADPEEVARSRQFPLRFLSAKNQQETYTWHAALERAIELSVSNVAGFPGRTLILVDRSGSMSDRLSGRSQAERWQVAGIFGAALAKRCEEAELASFDNYVEVVPFNKPILKVVDQFTPRGGTDLIGAIRTAYNGHDRIVVLTDEQMAGDYGPVLDIGATPIYLFNLAGYAPAASIPNVITFGGGLTDAAFRLLPLIERGAKAQWPWG